MKILLSPAKKLIQDDTHGLAMTTPRFESQAQTLLEELQSLSYEELKALYKVSDNVTRPMYDHYQALKEGRETERYPAIVMFSGIAYRYMAPGVFTDDMLAYINRHLLILSGLYGALSPLDGITPYRLEMGTKGPFNLYRTWKEPLKDLLPESEEVINLASAEYSRAVRQFRPVTDVHFLRPKNGKLQETAVYAKMARGAMVRWMAAGNVQTSAQLQGFSELGYRYDASLSSPDSLVFVYSEEPEEPDATAGLVPVDR